MSEDRTTGEPNELSNEDPERKHLEPEDGHPLGGRMTKLIKTNWMRVARDRRK